jgi:hypothetical protein
MYENGDNSRPELMLPLGRGTRADNSAQGGDVDLVLVPFTDHGRNDGPWPFSEAVRVNRWRASNQNAGECRQLQKEAFGK